VLILTASVGAGHNSAARAVVEAVRRAEGPDVEYVDVLDWTSRLFRAWYARGYALTVSKLPWAYGLGYHLTNWPQSPGLGAMETFRVWCERIALRRLRAFLRSRRPELIVHTHFLAPMLVAWMRRHGELDSRQIMVVTDNVTHRSWYAQEVDHWFVGSPRNVQDLLRWGVPEKDITRGGIPIHPKWTDPVDRTRALADWRLPADRKIVLLSAGTDFTCGPVVKIARGIAQAHETACVVVLAGRNKKLAAAVAALGWPQERLRAVSFSDKLHELATVAHLMVTKPGGITTAECLAKSLPMVLLKPVPGQEAGNARYLRDQGAAVIARGLTDTISCVRRLLADEQSLAALAARCRALYQPAAQTIAHAIRSLLNLP
jgi:processive 1,2-diacylglycerol beta-glucosyltransferase